jgi:type VI secretion system protein ImpA
LKVLVYYAGYLQSKNRYRFTFAQVFWEPFGMIGDLQQPSVIDLDGLLQPIEGDNPSGESLRYSGLYDEIAESRRQDDDLNQGEWQTELKTADYRRVIELAVPALTSKSKDLQIGAWLSEALVKQFGFTGLRDSVKLLTGLQENFWDTLHPEIDEGDQTGRANAISWFDTQVSMAIKTVPFIGGGAYGYLDWEDSKVFDFPESIESLNSDEQIRYSELKEQADKQHRTTGEAWRKALASTRRLEVETANFALEECVSGLKDLNRVIEEKFERNQTPGLSELNKALDVVRTQLKKVLEQKRAEEPDESDYAEGEQGELGADGAGASVAAGGVGGSGPIQSRRDALKRLADVAEYFQRTEPHSPVSYIVQRAVRWGNMPLESWLQDVIKDEAVLGSLRQTLGMDTNTGGGESENGGSSW